MIWNFVLELNLDRYSNSLIRLLHRDREKEEGASKVGVH